ncbi:MAG TPA: efflux RND transporter periplasmic adaptor subunit [Pyrinomonadaceae bacterium]|nr:efflux RND transporter periplasmic adaptor subunit [Pyrinomonadaceae bacterium]
MSTETIKHPPLVTGAGANTGTARTQAWLRQSWARLLAGKKKLLIGGGIMAAVLLAGFYFWGNDSGTAQYLTARVERGNLRNTVTATGTLQAVTTVQVGSQASGTISALYADFNSVVKKGQVIAQLDPSVAKAQVDQAQANLQQARASLAQAKAAVVNARAGISDAQAKGLAAKSTVQNNQAGVSASEANVAVLKAQQDDALSLLKQQESLLKAGVVAQRDYDVAMTAYKTAEARYNQAVAQLNQSKLSEQSSASAGVASSQAGVEQAKAQLQQAQAQVQQNTAQVQQAEAALSLAQVNLSHTTITSPIDGVVVSRDVNVGQTVAASLSAPTLFTIANDLTQMQVIANIDQADIGLVEQAKSVKFSVDAFPGKEFDGKIQQMRLNPVNVQNVVTYNVVIDVNNPEQTLKPGMTANLTITIDERNNVLKVPNSALRFRPQDANGNSQRSGGGQGQGQGQGRRGQGNAAGGNGGANAGANAGGAANAGGGANAGGDNAGGNRGGDSNFAPASAPVLPGQTRVVWVLGQDGKPQPRRIKIGLSDGASTEVVEGNLNEGDMVITGQTISGSGASSSTQQNRPPGFGNAPRGGGGGFRGR